MQQSNSGFITSAINQSDRLKELEKNISSDFYHPKIELIEFNYEKNIPQTAYLSLSFQNFVDLYALAGKKLDAPDPRVFAEIKEFSVEEGSQKIYEFCCHRGDTSDNVDILYNPDAPWSWEHTEKIVGELDLCLGGGNVFCFNVGTIYTVHPLSITTPYFDPSMWGFCLIYISQTTGKGAFVLANPIF